MNKNLYNEALVVWQAGAQIKDDYHSSTGLISNSFIGSFEQCQYGAVIDYSRILSSDTFNVNYAQGHLTEAMIFEGDAGFNKMLERYSENAYQKNGKPYKWVEECKEFANSVLKHKNIVKNILRAESSKYHQTLIFDMFGLKWKGEIDLLNLNKLIEVDLKTTAKKFSDRSWNDSTRSRSNTFIDDWNYHRQRAVYQKGINILYDEVVKSHILAVSKANKSVRMFEFDKQARLDYELDQIEKICEEIKPVIAGEVEPKQCEECEHCVRDEVIDFVIPVSTYCPSII